MKERYSNAYRVPAYRPYLIEMKRTQHRLSSKDEGVSRAYYSSLVAIQSLPAPLSLLIGREQEVGTLCALLQQPEVRLLTITGPGGVGKTSLALQTAADTSSAFIDGICFVSLAPICAIDLVLPTIARALGLRYGRGSLARVQAVIRDKHFLLLLDNFEQVADAASEVKALLVGCPHLKILITSRSALRLLEEREFRVAPLVLPDHTHVSSVQELAQVASVSLFLQRIRTTYPDFALTSENAAAVAQICVRLDGLPLALELAAARMRLFSPQSLLARLGHRLSFLTSGICDAPERQQTLRKTMEWSYHLLMPEEQRLFRCLSVFVGGCSLRAIEAISDTIGTQDRPLLDVVSTLFNQSLLQREAQADNDEQRFTMLETTREYALECLQNSDEEETVRQAHAKYYLSQVETRERRVMEGEGPLISPHPAVSCSDGLTPRQREVLYLLAQGLSSALIAERLIISLTTVNSHVRTIYTKLGITSRSAATRYVMTNDATTHLSSASPQFFATHP
jgi:predicted ATPase/DNA-binding CsgD family transcriptional regulator